MSWALNFKVELQVWVRGNTPSTVGFPAKEGALTISVAVKIAADKADGISEIFCFMVLPNILFLSLP